VEGTNKAHENGEAMGFVGVRLTVMLGHGYWFLVLRFTWEGAPMELLLRITGAPRLGDFG